MVEKIFLILSFLVLFGGGVITIITRSFIFKSGAIASPTQAVTVGYLLIASSMLVLFLFYIRFIKK